MQKYGTIFLQFISYRGSQTKSMKVSQKIIRFCLFLFIFCLISACSQKKNTFTSRTFHNLAAHYNGLYWANISLDEGIFNLDKAHKDDYSKKGRCTIKSLYLIKIKDKGQAGIFIWQD